MLAYGTYGLKDENLIRFAIDRGYRIIDTAESYGTEKLVGSALKTATRKKLFLISKVSPNYLRYADVVKSAINSVKALDTYIDLYLIHVPNDHVSLNETFSAMKKLRERHIIRYYGVSNFNFELSQKALKFGINGNEHEFSLLFQYNLDIVKLCNKHNIPFFAYRPFYGGELLTKFSVYLLPFAKKYKHSVSQIALRWIIQNGAIPIVGSKNKIHIAENIDLDFMISNEDFKQLGVIFSKFCVD